MLLQCLRKYWSHTAIFVCTHRGEWMVGWTIAFTGQAGLRGSSAAVQLFRLAAECGVWDKVRGAELFPAGGRGSHLVHGKSGMPYFEPHHTPRLLWPLQDTLRYYTPQHATRFCQPAGSYAKLRPRCWRRREAGLETASGEQHFRPTADTQPHTPLRLISEESGPGNGCQRFVLCGRLSSLSRVALRLSTPLTVQSVLPPQSSTRSGPAAAATTAEFTGEL